MMKLVKLSTLSVNTVINLREGGISYEKVGEGMITSEGMVSVVNRDMWVFTSYMQAEGKVTGLPNNEWI